MTEDPIVVPYKNPFLIDEKEEGASTMILRSLEQNLEDYTKKDWSQFTMDPLNPFIPLVHQKAVEASGIDLNPFAMYLENSQYIMKTEQLRSLDSCKYQSQYMSDDDSCYEESLEINDQEIEYEYKGDYKSEPEEYPLADSNFKISQVSTEEDRVDFLKTIIRRELDAEKSEIAKSSERDPFKIKWYTKEEKTNFFESDEKNSFAGLKGSDWVRNPQYVEIGKIQRNHYSWKVRVNERIAIKEYFLEDTENKNASYTQRYDSFIFFDNKIPLRSRCGSIIKGEWLQPYISSLLFFGMLVIHMDLNYIYVLFDYRDSPDGDFLVLDDPTKTILNKVPWKPNISPDKALVGYKGFARCVDSIKSFSRAFRNCFLGDPFVNRSIGHKSDIYHYLERFRDEVNQMNESQQCALDHIISDRISIIKGPPGTGKTSVAVLALKILSAYTQEEFSKGYKLLVSSDSNRAVDRVVEGLLKENLKVIRFTSKSYHGKLSRIGTPQLKNVSYNFLQGFADDASEKIFFKSKEEQEMALNNFRKKFSQSDRKKISDATIYACTLSSASYLSQELKEKLNIKGIRFPCSIVDEASQSSEMLFFNVVSKDTRKLVVIGDEKQLPCITKDRINGLLGYSSLFQNMINSNRLKLVMLNIQYRMHPEISSFSNHQFYNGSLSNGVVSIEDRSIPDSFTQIFKSTTNPKVFIDTVSEEKFDKVSFLNYAEGNAVINVVKKLNRLGVKGEQIGVITFYNSQVLLIESFLKKADLFLEGLLVNTVDGFQGSERDFIILSTVRANKHCKIGFVDNKQRLNVAITRARLGLVIIGSASTLSGNSELWAKLIDWYKSQDCFIG